MTVEFIADKATKNTIRFSEVKADESDAAKLGIIYIPKNTLGEIKWADGKKVVVTLKTAD